MIAIWIGAFTVWEFGGGAAFVAFDYDVGGRFHWREGEIFSGQEAMRGIDLRLREVVFPGGLVDLIGG
jgi:hypothetical protein